MKLVVIGAGPGGNEAAIRAAQLGAEVTLIEKDEVGGTCLNWGCIPTKSIIASAQAFDKAKKLSEFGIAVNGDITADIAKIIERKNKVVSIQIKGIRSQLKSHGIRLIEGIASIAAPDKVAIKKKDGYEESLEADRIILATGSTPAPLPFMPFDGTRILSSDDAVNLQSIPSSIIVIGAGVIGCEFACIFRQLGSEVTIVEMMPRALMTEDEEITRLFERELKKMKIRLITSAAVKKAETGSSSVTLHLGDGSTVTAEKVFVSIGRKLNTEGLGLENAGITPGAKGAIQVNEKMQTSSENIYAIGDITNKIMLAHVASKQGIVAAENACGKSALMDYSCIPAGVFATPEIGSVGLRENQAAEKGIDIKVGRFQFRALGKSHAEGDITGFIKIIAEASSDRVLGMHIIGPHASDLVHEGALAINARLTARDIAATVHAHPTFAEGLMEAAEDLLIETNPSSAK
ncbi:MAG: dihydrolipoyl dehydrogenase [Nitrospiraceae bacterium]|nr:dihydrolipoyl dehydrogenase [Nitrospiraceae bacterium]